jgi:hypothetical protein
MLTDFAVEMTVSPSTIATRHRSDESVSSEPQHFTRAFGRVKLAGRFPMTLTGLLPCCSVRDASKDLMFVRWMPSHRRRLKTAGPLIAHVSAIDPHLTAKPR